MYICIIYHANVCPKITSRKRRREFIFVITKGSRSPTGILEAILRHSICEVLA